MVSIYPLIIYGHEKGQVFPTVQKFYEILLKLNLEGLAIIMITHDLDAEDLIGNKVVAIQKGEVEELTTTKYLEKFK